MYQSMHKTYGWKGISKVIVTTRRTDILIKEFPELIFQETEK